VVVPADFKRTWCVFELALWCDEYRSTLDEKLFLVSTEWEHFASPFKSRCLSEKELAPLRVFRLDNLKAFRPCDRADVVATIVKRWGSEAKFEQFVRMELPTILAECRKRYYGLLQRIAGDVLEKTIEG
jgi:hypothetical protein